MPRPKMNVDRGTVQRAEEELGKIKESKVAIQLQGIIAAARHPVHQIVDILHSLSPQCFPVDYKVQRTRGEWIRDQPKGHMKAKLNDEQKLIIEQWLLERQDFPCGERIHWTLHKLKREIEQELLSP